MTEVEAVELILAGPNWAACTDCDGSGLLPDRENKYGLVNCESCDTRGKLLPADYVEACDILGREYPVYDPPRLVIPMSSDPVITGMSGSQAHNRIQINAPNVAVNGLSHGQSVRLVYEDGRWVVDD